MVVALHTLTGALYLIASLASGAGLALGSARAMRVAVAALAAGALAHGLTFALLHMANPPPPLTDLAWATSFMAWIGALAYLALLRRTRVSGLVVLVAPMAFLGVFLALRRLPGAESATAGSASLAHAHVLLASAGFALLGLAGLSGALFLAEHRRLKRRQALPGSGLPSLESLDRAGALALALGFPLLTLGVVTGAMWIHEAHGSGLALDVHEIGALLAWCVYLALAIQRFAVHRGARRCAISALAGFTLLSLWVVGAEMLV